MTGQFIVPDCAEPDRFHEPPGPVPAVYWYEYRDRWTGLAGYVRVLCVGCCARIRMASQQPGADHGRTPPATRIGVLRDANTQEPVI